MDALSHHFLTMAYNNAWANHRLLVSVGKLTDEEFLAARAGFFPSLKGTLNHLVTVDWFYVDALERSLRGQEPHANPYVFFEPEEPFVTCAPLQLAQREVDRRLGEVCQTLTDGKLQQPVTIHRRKGPVSETLTRILSHLLQHQIHHRGQAHAMLAGTGVKPPQLDEFFCANEASLRAQDFAELGFSEERIWKRD